MLHTTMTDTAKLRLHLNGLGLASVLIVHGLCFHEGRDAWELGIPSSFLLGGAVAGTLASAFLLPLFRSLTGAAGCAVRALPGAAAACLLLLGMLRGEPLPAALGCACAAFPLAFHLDNIAAAKRAIGLYLGVIFGIAFFFWQIPTVFPAFSAQGILGAAVAAACLCSGAAAALSAVLVPSAPASPFPSPEKGEGQDGVPGKGSAYETLAYLTGISIVFFLLNSIMDWQFYRMHARDFHVPSEVYLYLWAAFPLAGYWLEKRGTDSRILLFCLAAVIMLPLLIIPLSGTVLFWIAYVLVLFVKYVAILFLFLVFVKFRQGYGRNLPHGLSLCLPWLCLLASFFAAKVFLYYYVGIVPYFLLLIVLSASFGYLSMHVQYAMTVSGAMPVPAASPNEKHIEEGKEIGQNINSIYMAEFSRKYGFSKREQDVVALILENTDSNEIVEKLCISKNTLKTHVRQILRKSECDNRNQLISLFNEEVSQKHEINKN